MTSDHDVLLEWAYCQCFPNSLLLNDKLVHIFQLNIKLMFSINILT